MRKKKINPVRATSLMAYAEVLEKLGERQVEVLKCLNSFVDMWGKCSATNMMIADKLDWSINRVTPRIYELRQYGLVKEHKTDICEITGRTAIYWRFVKR